ncbi:unnamed protein product, partial [Ectocarpus sp. 12 AP-2014]
CCRVTKDNSCRTRNLALSIGGAGGRLCTAGSHAEQLSSPTGMPHHEFEAHQQSAQMNGGHQYTCHKLVAGIISDDTARRSLYGPVFGRRNP